MSLNARQRVSRNLAIIASEIIAPPEATASSDHLTETTVSLSDDDRILLRQRPQFQAEMPHWHFLLLFFFSGLDHSGSSCRETVALSSWARSTPVCGPCQLYMVLTALLKDISGHMH